MEIDEAFDEAFEKLLTVTTSEATRHHKDCECDICNDMNDLRGVVEDLMKEFEI